MHTGEILPLPPVLLGKIGKDSKKKTLLIYGHLDVQPALKSDGLVRKFLNRNIFSLFSYMKNEMISDPYVKLKLFGHNEKFYLKNLIFDDKNEILLYQ